VEIFKKNSRNQLFTD